MSEKSKLVPLGTRDDGVVELLWSKMPGFPYWPSRRGTAFEELALKNNSRAPQVVEGNDYVCVIFLGTKYQSGFVIHSNVEPLNSTTFHQFSAAPYKKNKDYAAGIWEAIRILNKGGQAEVLSDALIRQTLKDNTRTASVVAARDDNCICCMGTRISGPLMQCEHCKKKHIHFHCFKPPLKRLSEGIQKWFCDSCSLPLQSQPTVMFPVVRSGKPVPQWPFNLKPPRVSSGRVYELGSDSDSDEESEGAPQAKKRLKKIAKLKSDKKTSAVKKVAKLEEDDVAPEDDDEKKSVHSEGSSDKDQQKKSTFYSKNAYGKEQKPHAASRASPAINRSLLSPQSTQSQESIKSPVPVCDEEDEKCFICGDVGTLMLCDFPACPRVYHKMCVARVSNQSVDEDWATSDAGLRSSRRPEPAADTDDTWFCPLHNCLGCGALQQTPYSLRTLNPPAALLAQLKMGPQGIVRKPLRSCTSCPSSLCKDCEDDLGMGRPLFRSKKFEDVLKPVTRCLNCLSSEPRLKLARILEGAWVRMCRSRLAVPFLCTVLPGVGTSGNTSVDGHGSQWPQPPPASSSGNSSFDPLDGHDTNGTLAAGAAGESVAADQLNLSWERDFKELFLSVPSLTTQIFQATFFASSVCNRSLYQELNQVNVKNNVAVLAEAFKSNRASPFGLLDVLSRIRNLVYGSVHDFLLDLSRLRRQVASACHSSQWNDPAPLPPSRDVSYQTASSSSAISTAGVATSSTNHKLSPKRPSKRLGATRATSVVSTAQATEECDPSDAISKPEAQSPAQDVLDAFDTLIGVCIHYLALHKMELYLSQCAMLQDPGGMKQEDLLALSQEYSAAAIPTNSHAHSSSNSNMNTNTGTNTAVQLLTSTSIGTTLASPTLDVNFRIDLHSEDEADDIATEKSAKSAKSNRSSKSAKGNKNGRKPLSDVAPENAVSESKLMASPVAAIVVPTDRADSALATSAHPLLHELTERSHGEKDMYRLHLLHFMYLWRLSSECRFIGNMPLTSQGEASTAKLPHLFVGSRTLAGWTAFVHEGAREEEALIRRISEQHTAANEQSSRDLVSEWLDDTVLIEEKVSTKRAALSLLDLGVDGRNYANEGVTLLERRYGEPSLPWSKISKRFDKDDAASAAAKEAEANRNRRRGRSGSLGSTDVGKDDAGKTANGATETEGQEDVDNDDLPDGDIINDEPFEERPDFLRADDTWLMLDRMQDLTVRALHLQERLRKEYRQQQLELLQGVSVPHPLTLGDGQLLRELKFSNDNLRWRLRQKQASLGNAQDTVALLKNNVLQLEQKLERKTTELRDAVAESNRLVQQVARLEAENQRLKKTREWS